MRNMCVTTYCDWFSATGSLNWWIFGHWHKKASV